MAVTISAKHSSVNGSTSAQTRAASSVSYASGTRVLVVAHGLSDGHTNGLGTGGTGWTVTDNAATNDPTWTLLDVSPIDSSLGANYRVQTAVFLSSPLTATESFAVTIDANNGGTGVFFYGVQTCEVTGASGTLVQSDGGNDADGNASIAFPSTPAGFQLLAGYAVASHDTISWSAAPTNFALLASSTATPNGGTGCAIVTSTTNTATGVSWGWTVSGGTALVTTLVAVELAASGGATTATPAVVGRTSTVGAPTPTATAIAAPTVVARTSAVGAPTPTQAVTATPAVVAATTAAPPPSPTATATAALGAVGAIAGFGTPTPSSTATPTPTAVAGAATVGSPTPTSTATASPAAAAGSSTIGSPTPTSTVTAVASVVVSPSTVGAVTPTASATVTATAVVGTGTVPAPIADTGGGTVVTDDFDRTDADTLGGDYTAISGTGAIRSNRFYNGDSTGGGAGTLQRHRHDTALPDENMYVQAVIHGFASGGYSDARLMARWTGTNSFYELRVDSNGAAILNRVTVGGEESSHHTFESGMTYSFPETWRMEVVGTNPVQFDVLRNGVSVGTFDDSDGSRIQTGVLAGLGAFTSGGSGAVTMDDLEIGSLAGDPDVTVNPSVVIGSGTVAAPTPSASAVATPTAIEGGTTVPLPTAIAGGAVTVAPGAVVAAAGFGTPTPTYSGAASPAAVGADGVVAYVAGASIGLTLIQDVPFGFAFTVGTPTVTTTTNATATPAVVDADAVIPTPTSSSSRTATPDAVPASSTIGTPATSEGAGAAPAAHASSGSVGAPSISATATPTPAAVVAAATVPLATTPGSSIAAAATVSGVAVVDLPGVDAEDGPGIGAIVLGEVHQRIGLGDTLTRVDLDAIYEGE